MMEELKVIDQTAITLCRENALPLIVLTSTVRRDRRGDSWRAHRHLVR